MALVIWAAATCAVCQQITPPSQPLSGPGGQDYVANQVGQSTYGSGTGQHWIFEPQGIGGLLPVVAFIHGWAAADPVFYQTWIDHIVRKGDIVVFPKYQETALDILFTVTPNALGALKAALQVLGPKADSRGIAFASHSFGGVIAFNLAARAKLGGFVATEGLVFFSEPGDDPLLPFLETSLALSISSKFLVHFVVWADDMIVGNVTSRTIYSALSQVSVQNKEIFTVQSDEHESPALIANHFFPLSTPDQGAKTLGYYSDWKLLDTLMDVSFHGKDQSTAFGVSPSLLSMGTWSDGAPVKPMLVLPVFSSQGSVNAASFLPGPVAPGEIVTFFG